VETVIQFPSGFFWGAATASHQVEGNNRWNDWWECEQDGRLPYRSGDACRQFELYETDFELAQSWGHTAHRFSIEWSRIEPLQGQWNDDAIQHYIELIDALRRRGIEPILTLHHFTNPAWFAHLGGWHSAHAVKLFERYADFVTARLGTRVRYWLTINEPTVYVKRAYSTGDWPPCEKPSWYRGAVSLRNLCRAHVAAYDVIHRHRPDAMVGFAHSAPYVVPCDPGRLRDVWAAALRELVLNRLCFFLLGRSPRRVLDFLGVNYYTRQVVRAHSSGAGLIFGTECKESHHDQPRNFNSLGWEIYPPGLTGTLRRLSRYGVPLIVTENGISTVDETLRENFLIDHVRALAAAIQEGIDVRGYLYWTLYDNFEWSEGFNAHFGLAAVDLSTQQRLPRPSGERFASICKSNEVLLAVPEAPTFTK
jgi:beta-glucosidase